MVDGSKRHGVDRHEATVSELQEDHLEQVARSVGADHEHLRRIGVLVDVDHDDGVVDHVLNRLVVDAVPSCRPMELHTRLV